MSFKKILEKIENYILSRLLLLKLEVTDKVSKFISIIVISLVFASLAILFLFFFSITSALFLGDLLGNIKYGFATVSLFYLLVLLIVIIFRKSIIQKPILNWTVKYLFRKDKDKETNEEEQGNNK